MQHLFVTVGVLLYGSLMLWIIVPTGPLPCQTTEPSQLVQPNISLGAWDVEFISERFCQCYESENSFLRALPLLAAACIVAVLMVLNDMDIRYRERFNNEKNIEHESYAILCLQAKVHRLPNNVRYLLIVVALSSYVVLTIFTHRRVYGFRLFNIDTSNVAVHYTFTSLFFLCFTLLYANAVLDFFWLRNRRSWVVWFHAIAFNAIFLLSILFALFAILIEKNGKGHVAILIEYILFGSIFLAVPIWLLFANMHAKVHPPIHQENAQAAPYTELSIYDLKVDIL